MYLPYSFYACENSVPLSGAAAEAVCSLCTGAQPSLPLVLWWGSLQIKDLQQEPKLCLALIAGCWSGVSVLTTWNTRGLHCSASAPLATLTIRSESTFNWHQSLCWWRLKCICPVLLFLVEPTQGWLWSIQISGLTFLLLGAFYVHWLNPDSHKQKTQATKAQAECENPYCKSPSRKNWATTFNSSSQIRKPWLQKPKQKIPSYESSRKIRKLGLLKPKQKKQAATNAQAELENQDCNSPSRKPELPKIKQN